MQLPQFEQAFQELQGALSIRPLYHPKDTRIEAHLFGAFRADCLQVTRQHRLRALAPGLTPRAVLQKLAAMQRVDVHLPTTDGRYLILPCYLVRTQKFFGKGKAPPTLIENRELGLFFMEGQLLCDQRSKGGFAGCQLLGIATQRKPTQVFSTIFVASR
jgi:hypothetical protein